MITQRLVLCTSFDKVTLRFKRVKEDYREAQNRLWIVDVCQSDCGVFHVRWVGRCSHQNVTRSQSKLEVRLLACGFRFTLFAPPFQLIDVLDTLCDLELQGFERFAAGIEAQATFSGVQGFGELVKSQAGGCSAIPSLDVASVEF